MKTFHTQPYRLSHSQKFLRSPYTISRLVAKMNITNQDTVIEIGSGNGELTVHLLALAKEVIAVEADPNLCQKLKIEFQSYSNFKCLNADFVTWDLPDTEFKVVGNIPFARTAEIMRKLVKHQSPPVACYLIMQREAADKFVGKPTENVFSLCMKPKFKVEILAKIHRVEFYPSPRVQAALLAITKRHSPLLDDKQFQQYQEFIQASFSGAKPNIEVALRKYFSYGKMQRLARSLKFDLRWKRSEVRFKQWLGLFKLIVGTVSN